MIVTGELQLLFVSGNTVNKCVVSVTGNATGEHIIIMEVHKIRA